ncbi:hypothetical protein [Lysobacter enzymogenes]|uniref:hypothetical protein n=1 Tax=Lysobacter enzymogenes TaxID=69 RepID=UPI001A9578B3|nr:hypothetical protein [Lysobacter enzymogenes]QQP97937.1 hypothetical protein JHW38_08020 [Lysobacter enzymogenes]
MTNPFALDISRFVAKAKAAPELVVRKVALDLLTGVVMKTPVGKPERWKSKPPPGYVGGRARGSWVLGIDTPATTTTVVDKDGNSTILRGLAAMGQWGADKPFYITSNLPYIRRLEYEGWSQQAPAGMVRITLVEFQSYIDKAVKTLPK